jgi:ribonuclease E
MLINAQRPEELRIAIVRDTSLENFQVDVAESGLTRGNIYRGTISNIQPSLNAAFIDYGLERHGFLAIQDVVPEAYYHSPRGGGQPRIEEVLERGRPIVVQVARDAIGQKGSSLTTSLSLAGRYLVLTPFDDTRGVSRKVEDEEIRRKLKSLVANLELPEGCGLIVRTNALDQNKTAIGRDLAALLRLWKRVQAAALSGKGSRLLYSDQDLIVQALRDHLDSSIEELLIDDDAAFHKAQAYIEAFMPRAKLRLERYEERLPLFSRFDLEPQIDRIYERRVDLQSGGSIVIDATEALTAIDVNSGRSTRAATQEETAVHTNLEAAGEVARQLRLRDIGGLVVVDFIDMRASKNQRRVEKALRDAMKADKARSSIGRISSNGLLEINRQRIKQALEVRTHRPCPTCAGTGRLASPELVTLNLLRRIEARAASGLMQGVKVSLHPELADAMQNSRRQELAELEREFDIRIEIIAAAGLHRPEEQIEWFKRERPAARPARPKPAAVALKPWDLTLAAVDEESFAAAGIEAEEDLAEEPEEAEAESGRTRAAGSTAPDRHAKRRGRSARLAPPGQSDRAAQPARGGHDRSPSGRAQGGGRRGGVARAGEGGRGSRGSRTAGPSQPAPATPAPVAPDGQARVGAPDGGGEDTEAARRGRKRRRGGRKRKRGGALPAGGTPAAPDGAGSSFSHRDGDASAPGTGNSFSHRDGDAQAEPYLPPAPAPGAGDSVSHGGHGAAEPEPSESDRRDSPRSDDLG